MSRIFFVFMFSLLFVGCSEAQSAKSGVVNKVVSPAQFKELMKNKDDQIIHNIKHQAYLLCSYGSVTLDDKVLEKGDAAEILDINEFKIKANEDSEVLVIDAPK